ncbi:hypothetical protein DPMN_070560 [Dreissena polymorpha]|uniref:Uncharacterized protein n=1 Tax=Dreissena polymorpha TaxID=45954 RepID=A0A9D4BP11_DREPO|nr:hypothetical protein DPMN_070560 [Dreissena polymorpha]
MCLVLRKLGFIHVRKVSSQISLTIKRIIGFKSSERKRERERERDRERERREREREEEEGGGREEGWREGGRGREVGGESEYGTSTRDMNLVRPSPGRPLVIVAVGSQWPQPLAAP